MDQIPSSHKNHSYVSKVQQLAKKLGELKYNRYSEFSQNEWRHELKKGGAVALLTEINKTMTKIKVRARGRKITINSLFGFLIPPPINLFALAAYHADGHNDGTRYHFFTTIKAHVKEIIKTNKLLISYLSNGHPFKTGDIESHISSMQLGLILTFSYKGRNKHDKLVQLYAKKSTYQSYRIYKDENRASWYDRSIPDEETDGEAKLSDEFYYDVEPEAARGDRDRSYWISVLNILYHNAHTTKLDPQKPANALDENGRKFLERDIRVIGQAFDYLLNAMLRASSNIENTPNFNSIYPTSSPGNS